MFQELGAANDFNVVATDDAAAFTTTNLANFDAVVFLSTTGEVLNDEQQDAFEDYIQGGGGYVGIHSATDTEYAWPWYGEMLGGYFRNHPAGTPTATVNITDGDEPSTQGLPTNWARDDEWYNFQGPTNPVVNGGGTDYSPRNSGVKVLATIDEATYEEDDGNTTDDDHPVTWCSDFDGGHMWYTALGHTEASYSEANFRQHVLGGLETVTGAEPADCGEPRQATPTADDFEMVTIDDDTESPMELAVANDGRVFYVERVTGRDQRLQPGQRPGDDGRDAPGLFGAGERRHRPPARAGLRHDQPDLRRLHAAPEHQQPVARLAIHGRRQQHDRAQLRADHLPVDGPAGDVLPLRRRRWPSAPTATSTSPPATTPTRSNPTASHPIDERPNRAVLGRPAHVGQLQQPQRQDPAHPPAPERRPACRASARRTRSRAATCSRPGRRRRSPRSTRWASATRSASRSIRIRAGSSWATTGLMRPPETRTAVRRAASSSRSSSNRASTAGPTACATTCRTTTTTLPTATSGPKFNCADLTNDSPNNTGIQDLPPAIPATMWLGYSDTDPRVPGLGAGGAPTGGPRYEFDPDLNSADQVPGVLRRALVHRRVEQRLVAHRHAQRQRRRTRRLPDPVGGHVPASARDRVRA